MDIEKINNIKAITSALVEFHKKVEVIKKDSQNPFFNSKYASLSNILNVINPVLIECGLNIMHLPTGEGKLRVILSHISGAYIMTTFDMKIPKDEPQGLGSAITYSRRYAIGAILNLNIEDDSDGNRKNPASPSSAADKPWINATDKNGKINDTGIKAAVSLYQNETSWEKIKRKYRVSKSDQKAIEEYKDTLTV
jgi:hypothetical protein